ncbi:MAG: winged helix-turn-helix transcriptional regulator [Deltaproteobacteria bacterium]|nr:winged helix-turn-helix transcriptional regulator [Deltaproteobacteria bacterium]
MNQRVETFPTQPSAEQVQRLRLILADILQCCQDRMTYESKLFDLPQAEIKTLLLFLEERYLTAKNMALKLEVGKSRVSKVIQGLLAKGLIEKIEDPRDNRFKLLSLTRAGQEKAAQMDRFINEIHSEVLLQMESQRRLTVLSALELLWSAMDGIKKELRLKVR